MLGIRIRQSPYALEETDERLFPVSRHRSARVVKKLLRRHGGEFRKKPTIFKLGEYDYVVHPALYAKLREQIASQTKQHVDERLWSAMTYGIPTHGT